jgi:hypothetical protein
MKVKNCKNILIFWLPTGTSCRDLAIVYIEMCELRPFFSPQKSFVCVESMFFRFKKKRKICP